MEALPRSFGWTLRLLPCAAAAGLMFALPSGAVAANATKLSVACTPKQVSPGSATACVATVTDAGLAESRQPPTGTVIFSVEGNGIGTFDSDAECLLEPSGAFSSKCTVSYTPSQINGGEHSLLGTYEGDPSHGRATTRFALEVTPPNDEPDNATRLPIPAKVTGTTEGATWEYEDPDLCGDSYAPVWYTVKPTQAGRVATRLTVRGRVDSVVAVFRLDRSKLVSMGCALTDVSGVAGVAFDADRGTQYLLAVAAPWDARVGGFTLETASVPAVKLQGTELTRDARVTLDPLLRPGVAFSVRLRQGVTYRINATGTPGACLRVLVLRPSANAPSDVVRKSSECEGYLLYTPALGLQGSFPLVVTFAETPASATKGAKKGTASKPMNSLSGRAVSVHVSLRRAQTDDLAPGVLLQSGRLKRGALSAQDADIVDVYRFRVATRGDATLWVRGTMPADLLLLSGSGTRVACACGGLASSTLAERLGVGTYFAVVRGRPGATGTYAISLRIRRPTTVVLRLTRPPGAKGARMVAAIVSPKAGGRFVFELDQFDPLSGWHFARAMRRSAVAGQARVIVAPSQGRWRVRARYTGSLSSSPSTSGWAQILGS